MPQGNPDVCLIRKQICDTLDIGFILEVSLFASAAAKNASFALLGETIQIGKPLALQIVRELKNHAYRDVIVVVAGKEFSARISLSKEKDRYKIMDIDRTIILGYISDKAFHDFAGES